MIGPLSRLTILLALSLVVGGCGTDPGTPDTPAGPQAGMVTSAPTGVSPAKSPGAPTHLSIPAIGVSTPLVGLGLNQDGTVEVPTDPDRAGWYDLGPVPGQRGSSVILGHVDSPAGPAVFAALATLRRGQKLEVSLSDGTLITFGVRRVATYANADFPAQLVYAGPRSRTALNLVTCGGDYDPDRGGYQANVVVFTQLIPT